MKPLYSKKANRTRRSKGNNSFTNLAFESLEDRRMLAAVTVNTAADLVDGNTTSITSLISNPGNDGAVSLREALTAANNSTDTDTITFDAIVFNGEAADVIRLQQELSITQSVTIDASGLDVVISGDTLGDDVLVPGTFVSAFENFFSDSENIRPFSIITNVGDTVTLRGLTITGGFSELQDGGGISSSSASLVIEDSLVSGNFTRGTGGGISIENGSLIVDNSVIDTNQASQSRGGGVFSASSDVTISNSTLSENSAREGGGIFSSSGVVTISDSSISGSFSNEGGGISTIDADVILDRSTVRNNFSGNGAGIFTSFGSLTISNSTISANNNGGGIRAFAADVNINSSTVTKNFTPFGAGGILINSSSSAAEPSLLTINNSIIADNFNRDSIGDIDIGVGDYGEFAEAAIVVSSSLIGDNRGSRLTPAPIGSPDANGNIIGNFLVPIDPLLEDLADNGGPTQTHALLPGSPAIDAGETTLTIDQRGELRPNDGGDGPDIGSFEQQLLTLVVDTSNDLLDGDFSTGNQSLREAIERANSNEGVDTIFFDAQVFDGGADDVIRLLHGQLEITEGIVIDSGDLQIVVSGDSSGNDIFDPETFITDIAASDSIGSLSDNSRVFNIETSADELVSISGLTVTGGNAIEDGGGIAVSFAAVELIGVNVSGNQSIGSGGGIRTIGQLTLEESTVSGNFSYSEAVSNGGFGGGIAVFGSEVVTLNNSTVSENSATINGGGIYAAPGVTLVNSSVVDNSSDGEGGGISTTAGVVTLTDSTVSGNQSEQDGGGIQNRFGPVSLFASTVTGNSATGTFANGGGIATRSNSISLTNSTVSGNQSQADGGGIYTDTGSVSVADSTISGNSTAANGGGIATDSGSVLLTVSNVSGNQSVVGGGGIYTESGSISVSESEISGNSAVASPSVGGGVLVGSGVLTIDVSTISGNTAGRGGGLFVSTGEASLTSSTISGNTSVEEGGGIYAGTADLSISSSTVAFNESLLADVGGGIHYNIVGLDSSTFEIHNSVIASNIAAGAASDLRLLASDFLDLQFSLIGSNAATPLVAAPIGSPDVNGNLIGTSAAVIDPLLGDLSDNGGLTPTHALLAGSPAIDAGSSMLSNDQRGIPFTRDAGDAVDIGAFESQRLELLVDITQDIVDGNFTSGQLSLREAVQLTNANPGEDLISFNPNQFQGVTSNDAIFLGLGELTISESLSIDGQDLGIVISGDARRNDINVPQTDITDLAATADSRLEDNSSVLNITAAAGDLVTLTGLTITGGIGEFGGISNGAADLAISQSNISGNRSTGSGGGIFNDSGTLSIDRSTISDNQTLDATASGGGIYSNDGDVVASFSTISDNQTAGQDASGGGVYTVDGSIALTLSTISGNQTLGSNADGGGISSARGDLLIDNVTVTENIAAGEGGGVFVADSTSNPTLNLNNSIVAGNDAASGRPDLGFDSDGLVDIQFSLIGDSTGTSLAAAPVGSADANGNLVGVAGAVIDPLLGPLADNRGPTLTHELLVGSPAIDAGSSSLVTDQRDVAFFTRNNGGGVDIGSFERFLFNLVVDNSSDIDDGDLTLGNLSLREALSLSNLNPATDTITFDPTVFNSEQGNLIRLQDTLSISDGVIIDAGAAGIVISGDIAGDDVLVDGSNVTDTVASEASDTLDDNVRVIDITTLAGETVTIFGFTVTGGLTTTNGGGIRNLDGDLELTESEVLGNRTIRFGSGGGGIYSNDGRITLNDSIVSDNVSSRNGGGINTDQGNIKLNNSAVRNNVSDGDQGGGGVFSNGGDVMVNNSSVSSNNTRGGFGDGGGISIFGRGDVTLTNSTVENNSTGNRGEGGGIFSNGGDVTLTVSTVANNSAGEQGFGGGIRTFSGDVTVSDSTIANNTSDRGGGISVVGGDLVVTRSTISLNQSGRGGGGVSIGSGDLIVINSTISGNQSALSGGGFEVGTSDSIQFINTTITNNQSGGDGGGIDIFTNFFEDMLIIENSIVAGNITTGGVGADLSYGFGLGSDVRFSLIGSNNGAPLQATPLGTPDANGNLIGTDGALIDPSLGRLADNGGPTLTHGLLPGSPALNAGGIASIDVGTIDQRGADRIVDGQIDIGAFEGEVSQIADVILSSSGFSTNFIDAIDGEGIGSGNGLGFSLVGDQQLTSVPWQNIDTIHLQFLTDVSASLEDGDILLTGTNGGDYSLGPISFDTDSFVATVPILGGIGNDSLVISIFDGSVIDSSGESIVGDSGEQFNFFFNVLPGDEDGSGQVTAQDAFNVFASNADLTTPENARRDTDGSGQINASDSFLTFANNTHGLPAAPVAPTPPSALTSSPPVPVVTAINSVSGERRLLDQPKNRNVLIQTYSSKEVFSEEKKRDEVFSERPLSTNILEVPELDNTPIARTPVSVGLNTQSSISGVVTVVFEPTQSRSLQTLLYNPQTVTSQTSVPLAKSFSSGLGSFSLNPELTLAGRLLPQDKAEPNRDYFAGEVKTRDIVDPTIFDAVFQEDLSIDLEFESL